MGTEIKEILKQEEEEKQLRLTEMEVNKARNLIEHEQEIFSRPKKTWIQTGKKRAASAGGSGEDDWSVPLSKKRKKEEIKQRTKKDKQETVSLSMKSATYTAVYTSQQCSVVKIFVLVSLLSE